MKREDTPEFHMALRRAITYHPTTGEFTTVFPTTRRGQGARVGTLRADGSYIVSYEGQLYTASRLAYFWQSGKWPSGHVRLRVKTKTIADYRWANLELTGANRRSA